MVKSNNTMNMKAMEIRTGSDNDDRQDSYCYPSDPRRGYLALAILLASVVTIGLYGYTNNDINNAMAVEREDSPEMIEIQRPSENIYANLLPNELFEMDLYTNSDFQNKQGIVPSFWGNNQTCDHNNSCKKVWGPCYAKDNPHWKNDTAYKRMEASQIKNDVDVNNLAGYCRPGFLIIGQGKCGTSSLYHYLVGHPRVLPASEKQIHYFKYYTKNPMKWYLAHFPTASSFLGQGALMTGEASPGYLPYPDVVARIRDQMVGTKIICIGRDPLERAYSSYRYNYVDPAIIKLRKGAKHDILRNQEDSYYHTFLFSFEEMLKAELQVLKKCLAPGGKGSTGAEKKWRGETWGEQIYATREKGGEPPLVDLDGQCYGDYISPAVPRKQWQDLHSQYPEKYLDVPNVHLSQAMIGRSLYVYPLEWWYAMFPKEDLYFLCTEEMKDFSGEPLNHVGAFLGLPFYNFSSIVSKGMYNVGEHQGYDEITTWDTAEDEESQQEAALNATEPVIPISEEFRQEMLEFYRPHNERLFKMTGRRCNW